MGGVRPITDYWILARCKHGYFGGYPAGFLERARWLMLGGDMNASVWHIPGGMAHKYNGAGGMPLKGYGPSDIRIDLDPECEPDILMDVRELWDVHRHVKRGMVDPRAIIVDRPYTEAYADKYVPGKDVFPDLNKLVSDCLDLVDEGPVGVLDFMIPSARKINARCLARVAVDTGDNIERSSRLKSTHQKKTTFRIPRVNMRPGGFSFFC
jgi:hypothetical protein